MCLTLETFDGNISTTTGASLFSSYSRSSITVITPNQTQPFNVYTYHLLIISGTSWPQSVILLSELEMLLIVSELLSLQRKSVKSIPSFKSSSLKKQTLVKQLSYERFAMSHQVLSLLSMTARKILLNTKIKKCISMKVE